MAFFCRDVATKIQDLRVLIHCFTIKNESNMLSFKFYSTNFIITGDAEVNRQISIVYISKRKIGKQICFFALNR